GLVYALARQPDSRDGQLLWTRDTLSSIETDLILAGDVLIAQTSDDDVYGLDPQNGEPRWIYRSERALRGAPLRFGSQILVNQSGQILALDQNGHEVERYDAGTSSYPAIASDGREIVVGHQNGYVSILGDAAHVPWAGAARWMASDLENDLFRSSDAVASSGVPYGDDIVYVTLNGAVLRVATSDGQYERLGRVDDLDVALLPPAVSGDTLIAGNQQGLVAAFDLAERKERWRIQLEGNTFSKPAVLEDRVLLASTHDGKATAVALDLADGHEIWRRDVAFQLGVGSSALLYDGRFYVVGNTIHAFDPADGSEVWSENGALTPYQITVSDAGLVAVGYDASFTTTYLATFDPASGKRI
ncbi:MAG TPA: PQQ-binding-like beta-propeller repeat protein, partial [Roseiflexaceae bacterium]|nr:PQQ-binding-like beta-propeller repeat protein [Roseiflexaceae bacterium]